MPKSDNATEVTATTPNFALKEKLGPDVNIRDALPEEVVNEAEDIIEESKKDFFEDAKGDLHKMEEAYAFAIKSPKEAATHIKEIAKLCFSMKGQSETLGFNLLAHASKSLYHFCTENFRPDNAEQLIVVRKHLDTLNVIIKDKIQGNGGAIGKDLVKNLHLLTKKYE